VTYHRLAVIQPLAMFLNVSQLFRAVLELIHPFLSWQMWVCKAVIAESWHCKNTVIDQRVEIDRKPLQVVDVAFVMGFPYLFPEKPLIAEKVEFGKVIAFFVFPFVIVIYMSLVV
jgi:hypothetical protein